MARALTTTELAHLRASGQRSRLYLAIHKPESVYSARVNQSTFTDPVVEITYDGASGTLGSVLAGMTVWVGTSAGARDVGITRVRKTPTASVLYVPPGEIAWQNDLYLTVVDEFRLWTRIPQPQIDATMLMDWDIEYSDQHDNCLPVPVLGPHAVAWLEDGAAQVSFDASASWAPGSTISAYSWSAPGGSIDNNTSATPLITYTSPGTYRVSCAVTAANGRTATGYRRVFVFDADHPPVSEFQLQGSVRGDYGAGGWAFAVQMVDGCSLTDLVEGALVVLFAEDWYGDDQVSIGPIAGRENVISWGWIENESLSFDGETGKASFRVQGPSWWMQQCHAPAAYMRKVDDPASWVEFANLTIDKWIWHLVTWRSTAAMILDVLPSGDTRLAAGFEAESGPLWEMIRSVCESRMATILPACDRYGRLIAAVDPQLLPVASRSTVPVVHALQDGDWQGEVEIERRTLPAVCQVEVCGVGSETVTAYSQLWYARALSKYEQAIGSVLVQDRVVASDQNDVLEICGLLYGKVNNPYALVVLQLASNHRAVDISPQQYLTLSITAAQNPRGISWSSMRLVARRISITFDQENGVLLTSLECEAESVPVTAVPYYPPPEPINNELPEPEIEPDFSWTPPTLINPPQFIPPEIPPEASCSSSAPANGPFDTWLRGTLYDTDFASKFGRLRCRIRGTGATNPSRYQINGRFFSRNIDAGILTWSPTTADDFYTVYAVEHGARVATGAKDAVVSPGFIRTGTFSPPATVEISEIEIAMNASYGLGIDSAITSGLFQQATVLSTRFFYNLQQGGIYAYALWNVRGNALPAGWYLPFENIGVSVVYKNLATERYCTVRRRIQVGNGSLTLWGDPNPYWGVWNQNVIPPLFAENFTFSGGVSDRSATIKLGTANSSGRYVATNDTFRITTPTPGQTFDFMVVYQLWISPLPKYRIDFENVFLWNICPPED